MTSPHAPARRSAPTTSPAVERLLTRTRRRLRMLWTLDVLQLVAPIVAAAALGLVIAGRLTRWRWWEAVALGVVLAVVSLVGAAAVFTRLPHIRVARAADRAMRTNDALSTSLELRADPRIDHTSPFPARVHGRADAVADGADPRPALPFRWRGRRLAAAASAGVAAVALAFVANPQDAQRAAAERERAAVQAAAASVSEAAAVEAARPGSSDAAERLRELAKRLAATDELDRAEALIESTADELEKGMSPTLLGQKAATDGLQRSVSQEPLPGASSDQSADDQLRALADNAASMTEQERAAAADRLEAMAEAQAAANSPAAGAMQRAATALRDGDLAGAQAALGEAAQAVADAAASVSGQQANQRAADAARTAGQIARQAASGAPAAGNGSSPTPGTGAGSGSGSASGSGSGSPSDAGSGSGSGTGSGAGGGGQAGSGGGGCDGCTPGDGGVGTGRPGSGTANGPRAGQAPDTDPIFDPAHGTGGETGVQGGGQGSGDGGTIGKTNGETNAGAARIPVSEAIGTYARQATAAMSNPAVPPAVRAMVLAYFDELQQPQR